MMVWMMKKRDGRTDDGRTAGRTNTIYLEALHNRPLRGNDSVCDLSRIEMLIQSKNQKEVHCLQVGPKGLRRNGVTRLRIWIFRSVVEPFYEPNNFFL